jgi:hypothetical protein
MPAYPKNPIQSEMLILKIYLAGLVVLIVAVVLNLLANALGMATWYSFLNQVSQRGFLLALQSLKAIEILFLILLYPLLLGLAAYLTFYLTTPSLR